MQRTFKMIPVAFPFAISPQDREYRQQRFAQWLQEELDGVVITPEAAQYRFAMMTTWLEDELEFAQNLERFAKKLEKFHGHIEHHGPDECWPWTGPKRNDKGYGQAFVRGRREVAHRLAYELVNGPVPFGMMVI